MTRLESALERIQIQIVLLNYVTGKLNDPACTLVGPFFELGLGNGGTYDHLRHRLQGRRIIVFEREIQSHPSCVPPVQDQVLGEIDQTGRTFARANPQIGAGLHCDLGNGTPEYDEVLQSWLPSLCTDLVASGGYVLSSTELEHHELIPIPAEEARRSRRYKLYSRR